MFSKWLLNLVPTVACCLFIIAFPCGAGESDIPPEPGTSIDSDLMKEVKRQVTRNPKEREDALNALRKMLDSLQNEREKLLVECAIADVLRKYAFLPGMRNEELIKAEKNATLESKGQIQHIENTYSMAKDFAYFRYLKIAAEIGLVNDDTDQIELNKLIALAESIFVDWSKIETSMDCAPRDLRTQIYRSTREPFRKRATESLPENLSKAEREILVATKTLGLLKNAGAPEPITQLQEREIAVVSAIAEGVDPNKKLSEQIDWPKKETAEAVPTQKPAPSESMKKGDTRTYWPYAVAVALALLSLVAYMRYRKKCSR